MCSMQHPLLLWLEEFCESPLKVSWSWFEVRGGCNCVLCQCTSSKTRPLPQQIFQQALR